MAADTASTPTSANRLPPFKALPFRAFANNRQVDTIWCIEQLIKRIDNNFRPLIWRKSPNKKNIYVLAESFWLLISSDPSDTIREFLSGIGRVQQMINKLPLAWVSSINRNYVILKHVSHKESLKLIT